MTKSILQFKSVRFYNQKDEISDENMFFILQKHPSQGILAVVLLAVLKMVSTGEKVKITLTSMKLH